MTITEGTLGVEVGTDVTLVADTITITEGSLFVDLGISVTPTPDTISIVEGTLGIIVGTDITLTGDVLTLTEGTIDVQAVAPDFTIDGQATQTITAAYGSLKVYGNGENWFSL